MGLDGGMEDERSKSGHPAVPSLAPFLKFEKLHASRSCPLNSERSKCMTNWQERFDTDDLLHFDEEAPRSTQHRWQTHRRIAWDEDDTTLRAPGVMTARPFVNNNEFNRSLNYDFTRGTDEMANFSHMDSLPFFSKLSSSPLDTTPPFEARPETWFSQASNSRPKNSSGTAFLPYPAASMESWPSMQPSDPNSCLSVFLGNIPKNTQPDGLHRLMSMKGTVTEVVCDFRPDAWLTAFVTYSKTSEASKAVEFFNNRRAIKTAPPHRLVCCFAPYPPASLCCTPAEEYNNNAPPLLPFFPKVGSINNNRSSETTVSGSRRQFPVPRFSLLKDGPLGANLFVYGIPSDWTEVTLMRLCQEFGHIVGIRVPGAPTSGTQRLNKGFGFVSYDSVDSSSRALDQLGGRLFLGKPLNVQLKLGEHLPGFENKQARTGKSFSNNDLTHRNYPPLTPKSQENYSNIKTPKKDWNRNEQRISSESTKDRLSTQQRDWNIYSNDHNSTENSGRTTQRKPKENNISNSNNNSNNNIITNSTSSILPDQIHIYFSGSSDLNLLNKTNDSRQFNNNYNNKTLCNSTSSNNNTNDDFLLSQKQHQQQTPLSAATPTTQSSLSGIMSSLPDLLTNNNNTNNNTNDSRSSYINNLTSPAEPQLPNFVDHQLPVATTYLLDSMFNLLSSQKPLIDEFSQRGDLWRFMEDLQITNKATTNLCASNLKNNNHFQLENRDPNQFHNLPHHQQHHHHNIAPINSDNNSIFSNNYDIDQTSCPDTLLALLGTQLGSSL